MFRTTCIYVLVLLHFPGVASPAAKKLGMADVYTSKGKPDPEVLKAHFIHEGRVEDEVAIRIVQQCEITEFGSENLDSPMMDSVMYSAVIYILAEHINHRV